MIDALISDLNQLQSRTIGVISHVRPDADCIGSQVALCRWLKGRGFKAYAFNDDELSPTIGWLADHFAVKKTTVKGVRVCDAYIFVDGNHPLRFGRAGELAASSGKPLYLIDHHPDPADIYNVSVSDVKASSTCELVFGLFERYPDVLDVQSAESLYAGIMTDTGSFRFDSVTANTHAVVEKLIRLTGLQTEPIHRRIYDGKSQDQIKLLASVLGTIELRCDGQIAILTVTKKLLASHNAGYHDLEGMVNYGLSITGVKAAVLFCELYDRIKLSFRSVSHVDVNIWARSFNGGGHVKASGGWYDGDMESAVEEVLKVGQNLL